MKSTGSQFRSWSYVVDCASAILYILLKGKNGEAYNIADEASNISIRELAEITASMVGRKVVMEVPDETENVRMAACHFDKGRNKKDHQSSAIKTIIMKKYIGRVLGRFLVNFAMSRFTPPPIS